MAGFSRSFGENRRRESTALRRLEALLAPMNREQLEALAAEAQAATRRNFGRTVRMFAPLYVSNECINNCQYCGFSRDHAILRVTLEVGQVESEARHLVKMGFRSILLVAGEHPKWVSSGYLQACVERISRFVPSVALEVGPMEEEDYRPLVSAGAEGLVVYQETYHRETYGLVHTAGPKRNFDWRLDCAERAYAAGFRRLGIGFLMGLAPWREEALALGAHLEYLLRHCWKSFVTVSLPRLRPAAGEFRAAHPVGDQEFVQAVCALRVCFPQVGMVLSTRETPALRDGLIPLGITTISAGSHTEPGGYTGAGKDRLHRTERGRQMPVDLPSGEPFTATEQFHIADERPASVMAERLRELGLEPVWKDWDVALQSDAI